MEVSVQNAKKRVRVNMRKPKMEKGVFKWGNVETEEMHESRKRFLVLDAELYVTRVIEQALRENKVDSEEPIVAVLAGANILIISGNSLHMNIGKKVVQGFASTEEGEKRVEHILKMVTELTDDLEGVRKWET